MAVPRGASAQTPESLGQARYALGLSRYQSGEYDAALAEFRSALQLFNSPNSRLMEARCLRRLGRLAEAVVAFDRAARAAAALEASSPPYRQTRAAAEAELADLSPRVARLVVRVTPPDARPRVRVGDVAVPEAGLGVEMPWMPGAVTVQVEADGFEPQSRDATLREGERTEVTLTLPRARTRERAVIVPPTRDEPPRGVSPWTLGGGIALGVAGASVGLSVVFGLLAQGRFTALDAACAAGNCPLPDAPEVTEGRRFEALTNVFFWTAIGTAATGVVLLVVGARAAPVSPRAGIMLGPGTLRVRF